MPALTRDELDEFLRRPQLARIATLREDGSPHVNPVWYEYDGKDIYIIPRKRSRISMNVLRAPRVAVLIDEPSSPYTRVLVEGRAQVVEGPVVGGKWVEVTTRMASRYFGPEIGPKYLKATLDQPRYLLRVSLGSSKVTTWRGTGRGDRSEWHPRYYEPGTAWHEQERETRVV